MIFLSIMSKYIVQIKEVTPQK